MMTKERILYFLMGTAAAMFVAADVIAEFDHDSSTHTATSWVKKGKKNPAGLLAILVFVTWLPLHFLWNGFPL